MQVLELVRGWLRQPCRPAAGAAHDVPFGTGPQPARPVPWQFAIRGFAVVTGLTLLLLVDVRGVAFYFAWASIGLALLSEATATLVYWRRSRG